MVIINSGKVTGHLGHLTITLSVCISYAVETDTVRGHNIKVLRIKLELKAYCVSLANTVHIKNHVD